MKKQQGFTLIELMIVVAVIGVLSAIAIPAYQDYAKKGALGSALATATALKTPVETYIAENGEFPDGNSELPSIPDFEIGSITVDQGTSAADGTVVVTLSGTSASGASVTLTKTAGKWSCGIADAGGITIKGCDN